MRFVALLKTLALTLALLLALDYASFAATGQSLLLGKVNTANQVTTIERTTAGPALSLVTKPGKPPLKVNRAAKVKKLNADLVDGLGKGDLARRPLVSAFVTTECTTLPSVPSTFTKITDLATFTKTHDDTLVRLDLANRMRVNSMTGTGVIFELRIDDAQTTIGAATALVRSTDVNTAAQRPFFGIFDGLSTGPHTVSVWARANTGSATDVSIDPGCWNSADVNNLYVTEF